MKQTQTSLSEKDFDLAVALNSAQGKLILQEIAIRRDVAIQSFLNGEGEKKERSGDLARFLNSLLKDFALIIDTAREEKKSKMAAA